MAATMTPHLRSQMLAALHGAEGEWGPSAEPLLVTLRLESPEDLKAVAQTLDAWGAAGIRADDKGPALVCRLPPVRLWDLLGLEGVVDVAEGGELGEKARRGRWWTALGAGVVAAGLLIWWLSGQGTLRPGAVDKGALSAAAGPAQRDLPKEGVVTAILSGDRLRLASGRLLRLAGLSAPAFNDPVRGEEIYGPEARKALASLAEGKAVGLAYPSRPQAEGGYLLAFLKLADGTDLGASLLERGAAQVDMESAGPERRATYSRLEAEARQAKRGLWGGPIVGNLASKVYHLPGGRFYHRVGPANRVLFTTELEALSAGYRPSTR